MTFTRVFSTELLKLKRSKMTWLSFLFYIFFGLMAWFVFWMLRNPEAARNMGLIGQKASFAMNGLSADWQGFFSLFAELGVAGGMIILSIIVIYLFGREYTEGTAKNILALPVPRSYFVAAKLCVAAIWFSLLTAFLIVECLLIGKLLGLGIPPAGLIATETGNIVIAALSVLALQPLVAWVTVASAGYLVPFGYTIATLLVGNLMIRTEWARWFPWSIVALLSGMAGPRQEGVVLGSTLVLMMTFVIGVAGTIAQQVLADNCQ
ncbi:MAG: ABC transporter permease [Spirochaetes bacterium]|nr:ABC transporter permease [Spirochaetota bacterium]